jgi:hypothetical protein
MTMSDPKRDQVFGPNSIGTDFRIIDDGEVDTRVRPMSEVIAELREKARKRREQQQQTPPPPKENSDSGTP